MTTPIRPPTPAQPIPEDQPDRLGPLDRSAMYAAAKVAVKRYPGPAGEMLSAEIRDYADFGYRIGTRGNVSRLIVELLDFMPVSDASL